MDGKGSSPVSKMCRARWRAKCKAASSGEIALQPSSSIMGGKAWSIPQFATGSRTAMRTTRGPSNPASNASWATEGSRSVGISLSAISASNVARSKGMSTSVQGKWLTKAGSVVPGKSPFRQLQRIATDKRRSRHLSAKSASRTHGFERQTWSDQGGLSPS